MSKAKRNRIIARGVIQESPQEYQRSEYSAAFQSVAVAEAIRMRLLRFADLRPGRSRVLVKDGSWAIPPIERPPGWNERADWKGIRDTW